MEGMGTLKPPLHQSMERLVISTPFLTREGENKILEACAMNLSLDNIRKAVIPRSSTTKIFSAFECMGIKL